MLHFSFSQVSLVNCSSNAFSLQLQKEVLLKLFSKLTIPLTSKFLLYLDSKGRWGGGVLGLRTDSFGQKVGEARA